MRGCPLFRKNSQKIPLFFWLGKEVDSQEAAWPSAPHNQATTEEPGAAALLRPKQAPALSSPALPPMWRTWTHIGQRWTSMTVFKEDRRISLSLGHHCYWCFLHLHHVHGQHTHTWAVIVIGSNSPLKSISSCLSLFELGSRYDFG